MNRAALLSQLQIDRSEPLEPQGRWPRGLLIAAAVVLMLGALAWFLIARPDRPLVRVAEATAAGTDGGSAGGSLLDASGYVVARRAATVSSKITGKVADVFIEEGQHVTQGQVLARLDDTNARAALAQANAEVAASAASLRVATLALEQAGPREARKQKLHSAGYVSDQAVEDQHDLTDTARAQAELARRQGAVAAAAAAVAQRNMDDTVVRAPFAGVVTVKAAQPGEIVSPISAGGGFTRTGIGTIVDMDSLEVEVDVAENFINRVRAGMPATVKLNAYPDWEVPAEVIAVIPTANRSKATVSVRVGLKVHDPRVVPDMGAHVAFLAAKDADAPAGHAKRSVRVPADAVVTVGPDRGIVFVAADGKLERRAVRLGPSEPAGQVLLAGLRPGETVAVGGLAKLRDGERVRIDRRATRDEDQ